MNKINGLLGLLMISSSIMGQNLLMIGEETRNAILKKHNHERQIINIPDLVWSEELAAFAEEWALQLAKEDQGIHHRPPHHYGENIFWSSLVRPDYSEGVQYWNDEKKIYRYKAINGKKEGTGHYTQVIWKKTEKVGCGCAQSATGKFFLVCNYDPPGNYIGQKPY